MNFSRDILGHEKREAFFRKHRMTSSTANVLVWCLHEGKVHGACVALMCLGPDRIEIGTHAGKVWWPQDGL